MPIRTGNQDMITLSMVALREIPQVQPDAKTITALVKQGGRIVGYQLSDSRIVSKQEGLQLARQGDITGLGSAMGKSSAYVKVLPDGRESSDLGSLPSMPPSDLLQ